VPDPRCKRLTSGVVDPHSRTQSEANSGRPRRSTVLTSNDTANISGSDKRSDFVSPHDATQPVPVFLEALTTALPQLKDRLQRRYEQTYPALAEIIRYVIDQEEFGARELSLLFPHLLLPALVEVHMAQLGLQVRPLDSRGH
jgi:hypothetical protein